MPVDPPTDYTTILLNGKTILWAKEKRVNE